MKRITLGLPEGVIEKLLWVEDQHRTNELSLTEGGTELVVIYEDGQILGYDKVKNPSRYAQRIRQAGELKKVYARDPWQGFRKKPHSFKEIWAYTDNIAELENQLKVYDWDYREAEKIISHTIINLLGDLKKKRLYFLFETESGFQVYIEKRIVVAYIYDCMDNEDLPNFVECLKEEWKPIKNENKIVPISEFVNFSNEAEMTKWIMEIVEDGLCSIKKINSESFLKQIILKSEDDIIWSFMNGSKCIDDIRMVASLIADRDVVLENIIH